MTYELTGAQLGDIKVIKKWPEKSRTGRVQWHCLCLCGKLFLAETYTLTSTRCKRESCGYCYWHVEHKEAYDSWQSMKARCDNIQNKDYPNYGGRGIGYDFRWLKFTEFYKDMGDPGHDPATGERLTLDRINVNLSYSKDNCRWATRSQQQLNRRHNKYEFLRSF